MKRRDKKEIELKTGPWVNIKNGCQYNVDAIAINCTKPRGCNIVAVYHRVVAPSVVFTRDV